MNSLIKLEFEKKEVRTVSKDGNLWFVANDVCRIVGIKNSRMAMRRLEEDEKGVSSIDSLGGKQETNLVNESGLYGLTFMSNKPEAKKFRKWVTSEVLPSIRKHGGYISKNISEDQLQSLMDQLHTAKIEAQHYKCLAELESKAVELWKAKSEYASIGNNGLPRLLKRRGAWVADPRFNSSIIPNVHQLTFSFA